VRNQSGFKFTAIFLHNEYLPENSVELGWLLPENMQISKITVKVQVVFAGQEGVF
jgi:hypothetical protein